MKTHVPPPAKDVSYLAEIDDIEPWTLVELTSNIQTLLSLKASESDKPANYYTIVGCIAGGEAGVDMADALSEHIGVLSNGTQGDFCNRRDKKVQQDLVRRTGMRAVRQECGSKWEDVVDFLMSESFPVVRTHMRYIHIHSCVCFILVYSYLELSFTCQLWHISNMLYNTIYNIIYTGAKAYRLGGVGWS